MEYGGLHLVCSEQKCCYVPISASHASHRFSAMTKWPWHMLLWQWQGTCCFRWASSEYFQVSSVPAFTILRERKKKHLEKNPCCAAATQAVSSTCWWRRRWPGKQDHESQWRHFEGRGLGCSCAVGQGDNKKVRHIFTSLPDFVLEHKKYILVFVCVLLRLWSVQHSLPCWNPGCGHPPPLWLSLIP